MLTSGKFIPREKQISWEQIVFKQHDCYLVKTTEGGFHVSWQTFNFIILFFNTVTPWNSVHARDLNDKGFSQINVQAKNDNMTIQVVTV